MLRWRLAAAAAMIAPLLLLLWLDDQWNGGRPGIWVGSLAAVVSVMATYELNQFLRQAGLAVADIANMLAVFCVTGSTTAPLIWREALDSRLGAPGWTLLGLVGGIAIVFLFEMVRYRDPGQSIQRLAGGALAIGYVGLLVACLIQLRLLLPSRLGLLAIVATIWVVKLADAGAYFVGRKFGRTPLCRISPKKTIEGLVGGVVFAIAGAILVRGWMLPNFAPSHVPGSLLAYSLFAVCLTIAGLTGTSRSRSSSETSSRRIQADGCPG